MVEAAKLLVLSLYNFPIYPDTSHGENNEHKIALTSLCITTQLHFYCLYLLGGVFKAQSRQETSDQLFMLTRVLVTALSVQTPQLFFHSVQNLSFPNCQALFCE